MNILKGGLFVFIQSYKRQIIIFWSVLLTILAISFLITQIVQTEIRFMLSISIPVYVFFFIIGGKFLTNTLNYFLRFGMSRGHYIQIVGIIFVLMSLMSALSLAFLHEVVNSLMNKFATDQLFLIHPSYFFDPSIPFHYVLMLDFVILLFCLVSGLVYNFVFYRFGTAGGYSLNGFIALLIIIALPLEWYSMFYDWIVAMTFVATFSLTALISVILYVVIAIALRNLPAVPA